MKLLLKAFRNGLGAIIAFISWIIPTSKVERSIDAQHKIDEQTKHIELYQFFGCPFCIKIRRLNKRLNLKIITRDAQINSIYRNELLKDGGQVQVPCLKITENKNITWMYESSNIAAYLEKRFG